MKKFSLFTLLAVVALAPLSFGQVYQPKPKTDPSSDQSSTSTTNKQDSNTKADSSHEQSQNEKSLFGNELPFINPHDETITLNGQTFAIGDNRVLSARFEKYLNEPEESLKESMEYHKTLSEILKMLDPNKQDPKTLSKIAKLLTKAASYPGDAGVCDTLAQIIYTSILSKKGANGKRDIIASLNEESRRIAHRMQVLESLPMNMRDGKNQTMVAEKRTTPVYQHYVKRLAEIEAQKKLYEGENSLSSVEAKIQFQASILHLFFQRRFQHVRIGARVYNRIFKDGDAKLRIQEKSKAAEVFGKDLGMPPTISMLDALSSEAIHEAESAIKSIDFLIENDELISGGKRLSEAFLIGEFTEPVATYPREKKRKIQTTLRSSYKLLSAVEAKDYGEADKLVNELSATAKDFDGVKARSVIAAYTRASDMHLFKARQAIVQGNQDVADQEIRQAIEIWPRNPKLDEMDQVLNVASDVEVARNDFKRHLREKNYRQIFQEQYRFAPAIKGDPELEDAFKQIISNIALIETAIAKATEFSKLGQDYAAWEELRAMRDNPTFSQDPELGKQLEDLTAKVSDLTKPLDQARRLEAAGETGSALAWFLAARKAYPNSKFAKEGIDRIVAKVL